MGTIVPRNGTAAEIEQIVLLAGEVAYCTDTGEIRIGDGSTAGGVSISIGETNLNSGSLNTVNNGGYPYVVAIGSTTDATPTALNLTDYSGDIDNTVVTAVPFPCDANKSYAFLVHLAARKDDGTSAMFLRQAVIKNVSDTVSLEGAVQTVGVDINPANWTVAISADDANKCLQILVTGAEAANIRWVAMVQAVEIGF